MVWEQLECDTEVLPFLEAVPEEEKELSPAEKEFIEQCLDIIHSIVLED